MEEVRVALVGVGNCASSLVQGVHHYANAASGAQGLIHSVTRVVWGQSQGFA